MKNRKKGMHLLLTALIALILADGSVYAITGLRDDNYLFLGLNSELKPIEDFLER